MILVTYLQDEIVGRCLCVGMFFFHLLWIAASLTLRSGFPRVTMLHWVAPEYGHDGGGKGSARTLWACHGVRGHQFRTVDKARWKTNFCATCCGMLTVFTVPDRLLWTLNMLTGRTNPLSTKREFLQSLAIQNQMALERSRQFPHLSRD